MGYRGDKPNADGLARTVGRVTCGTRAAALRQSTLHFKFKVMELLETFVKRAEASPLLIDLILPLLRTAADNTSGSNAQVRELICAATVATAAVTAKRFLWALPIVWA